LPPPPNRAAANAAGCDSYRIFAPAIDRLVIQNEAKDLQFSPQDEQMKRPGECRASFIFLCA
jgi:hypothetical protein